MLKIPRHICWFIILHLHRVDNHLPLNIKNHANGIIECYHIIFWVVICHVHISKEFEKNSQNELYDFGCCGLFVKGYMLTIDYAVL